MCLTILRHCKVKGQYMSLHAWTCSSKLVLCFFLSCISSCIPKIATTYQLRIYCWSNQLGIWLADILLGYYCEKEFCLAPSSLGILAYYKKFHFTTFYLKLNDHISRKKLKNPTLWLFWAFFSERTKIYNFPFKSSLSGFRVYMLP